MYSSHPSKILNTLFSGKPFQGTIPEDAKFLFIGLDANYRPDIERHPIFTRLCEYHEDGVEFWQRYGVHHPFLLDDYSGDGTFYHKSFAKIGFAPRHAGLVSFIELLHVPTTGRNLLTNADLESSHLTRINRCIADGKARHIFISAGVQRLMRASKKFPWLPDNPIGHIGALKVLFQAPGKTIYLHLHFSCYGKFAGQKQEEAKAISTLFA